MESFRSFPAGRDESTHDEVIPVWERAVKTQAVIIIMIVSPMVSGRASMRFWDTSRSVRATRPPSSSGIRSILFSDTSRHNRFFMVPISWESKQRQVELTFHFFFSSKWLDECANVRHGEQTALAAYGGYFRQLVSIQPQVLQADETAYWLWLWRSEKRWEKKERRERI